MIETAELHRRLVAQLPGLLQQIEQIVAIDSGSMTADGVDAVHAVLTRDLAEAGCAVTLHPIAGFGDCLEVTWQWGEGPAVVVLGHADTVWPEGTAAEWPYAQHDGWIEGPGVGDMKAALVSAVAAMRLVAELPDPGWGRMTLLVTPDELRGSAAARGLLEEFAGRTDVCLTLEGVQSGGGMVVARGAVGALTLTAHGRTAHCTESGGASVISELIDLLPRIETLSDPDAGKLVSIGVVRAGTARQVVPDLAEVEIDVRGATVEIADEIVRDLQALVDGPRRIAGVRLELTGGVTRPAFGTDRSDALYALAAEAAADLQLPSRGIVERGGSDGSFFGALGVLTLDGLGPYCENSCSRRERVEVDSIVQRAAVLAALLVRAPAVVLGNSLAFGADALSRTGRVEWRSHG